MTIGGRKNAYEIRPSKLSQHLHISKCPAHTFDADWRKCRVGRIEAAHTLPSVDNLAEEVTVGIVVGSGRERSTGYV